MNAKELNKIRRRKAIRVRAKINGTAAKPRLSIFRSNKSIYAQMIDDENGRTLISASDKKSASKSVGLSIALKAKKIGIKKAVIDRGSYRYHGRVKDLAEGAKEGGLAL